MLSDRLAEMGTGEGKTLMLLREGLEAQSAPKPARRFRSRPRALGLRPGFDAGKLNQLVDELEADAVARRLG